MDYKEKTILEFLNDEFDKRTNNDPEYSIRKFAADLDIDHSTLTKIFSKKTNLSKNNLKKIINILDFPNIDFQNLPEHEHELIKEFENEIFSSWKYFATLTLLELPGVSHETKELAQHLNIPTEEMDAILNMLIFLNRIEYKNNKYSRVGKNVRLYTKGDDFEKASQLYSSLMDHNKSHIEKGEVDKFAITLTTMSISPSMIPLATKLMLNFTTELSNLLKSEDELDREVYTLSMELMPAKSVDQ